MVGTTVVIVTFWVPERLTETKTSEEVTGKAVRLGVAVWLDEREDEVALVVVDCAET